MAIAFDKKVANQSTENTSDRSVLTVATGGVSAGNLVVVGWLNSSGSALTSISDTGGNTYTFGSPLLGSAQTAIYSGLAYSLLTNSLAAGETITCIFDATFYSVRAFVVTAYSGIVFNPLDQAGTAQDNLFPQTQPVGPSLTTTAADELLVSFIATQNVRTFTATASWTNRDTSSPGSIVSWCLEDRIVAATGTYNSAPTLSSDDYWNAHTLTFKAGSPGGGGAARRDLAMIGVG